MIRVVVAREYGRVRGFVVHAEFVLEPDRIRLDRIGAVLAHQVHDAARIEATAQECAERYVRDHLQFDRVRQQFIESFEQRRFAET